MQTSDLLLGRPALFVGRQGEIAAIDAVVDGAQGGGACAVVVTGGAGIGKSRLARELAAHWARSRPHLRVWSGEGDSRTYQSPFGVLGPLLRAAMGVHDGDPPDEIYDAMCGFYDDLGAPASPRHVALICELAGVSSAMVGETLHGARQEPHRLGDMMATAWIEMLQVVLERGPVAIVIDDLHWSDRPTLGYLDAALRQLSRFPLVVVGFARQSIHERYAGLWAEHRVRHFELPLLERDAGCELVRHVLHDADQSEVARIVDNARGNALLLEELMREVARGQQRTAAARSMTPAELVQRRLTMLPKAAQTVLRYASVLGRRFWIGALKALVPDLDDDTLAEALRELVQAELIQASDDARFPHERELVFRHDLVGEVAYASLPVADRAAAHRLAGEWLTLAGEVDSTVLADHWARGDVPARAHEALTYGAHRALAGHDFGNAIVLADRAISFSVDSVQAAALHQMQAEAQRWLGRFTEAAAAARLAASKSEVGSELWLRAVEELLVCSSRLGHFDDARAWIERITPIEPSPPVAAQLVATLCAGARLLFQAGDYHEADAVLAQIRAHTIVHQATMSLRALAESSRLRGARARHRGDIALDYAGYADALALLERMGDERNACNTRVSVAFALIELGAFEHAELELLRAHRDAVRMGMSTVENRARQNLALVAAARGDLDEACELASAVIETTLAEGNPRFEGWTRIYLSQFAHAAGDFTTAVQEAERAMALTANSPPAQVGARGARARARLSLGDLEGALKDATDAKLAMDKQGGIEEFEALVRLASIEAHMANGVADRAAVELAEAQRRLVAQADEIHDDLLRESFLTRVPLHVRLLALADAGSAP